MVANFSFSDITYNPKTGRYHSPYGGFLSHADMQLILRGERQRLEGYLSKKADKLLSGQDLGDWQRSVAYELKLSVIQATILGAGGKDNTTAKHYGLAGAELRRQYQFLNNFANAIHRGELSEAQIKQRTKQYANTVVIAYNQAEQASKKVEEWEGMRVMSTMARHCNQCPTYQTFGWVGVDKIIPVGVACDCGGNCQCFVSYRRKRGV